MKKRLIGIILGVSLLGGVGYTAINIDNTPDNKAIKENVEAKVDKEVITDNAETEKESNSETAEDATVNNGQASDNNVSEKSQEATIDVQSNNTNANVNENSLKTTVSKNNNITSSENITNTVNTNTNTSANNTSSNFMIEVEQQIYNLVNSERAKANLSPLSYNATMEKYARIKSQDMGDRGYFDHADPEGRYITDTMKADGVTFNAWAENIAYIGGNTDATVLANQFMNNWMNSSDHRANILSNKCTSIGIGVYSKNGKVYATQEFYN